MVTAHVERPTNIPVSRTDYNAGLEVALQQIDKEVTRLQKINKKWTISRISALRTLAAQISQCKVPT